MADNINDIIGQELLTRLDTLNRGLAKTVDTMELANREGLQLQETISAAGLSGNFVQLNGTLKQLGPLYDRINQAQREYTATSGMIGKAQAQLNALNTEEAKTLAALKVAIQEAQKALLDQAKAENEAIQKRKAAAEADRAYAQFEKEKAAATAEATKELQRQATAHAALEKEVDAMWQKLLLEKEAMEALAAADAEKIKASEQDILFTNQQEISTEAYNKALAEEEARIMALAEAQGANNIESKQNLQVSQEQVAVVTQQVTKAAQLSKELFLLRDELLMINKALLENNKAFAAGTISESEYIAEQTALTEKQSLTKIQMKETTAALKEQQGVVKSSTDLTDKFGNIVQRMGLRMLANLVIFQAAMNLIEGISKEYEDFQKQQTAVQDGLNAATQKGMDNADELAVKINLLKERFFALNATTEDQKQVTLELKDAIGETAGKMDTLTDAEDFFLNKSDAYIQAIQLRAKAQAALAVIVENNSKLLAAELDPEKTAGFLNKAGAVGDALNSFVPSILTGSNPLTAAGDAYRKTIKEQGDANVSQLKQTTQSQNDALSKMYLDYIAQAQKLSKQNGFNFNENKNGSSSRDHNSTAQRLKNEQELTKLIAEEEAKQIEAQMQTLKLEADNENNTLEDRLLAWRNYQHLKLLAQEAATEAQKKEAKEGLDQIKYIEDHAATEGIDAQDQAILDKKKIFQQQLKNAVADEQYIEAQITRETQEGNTKIYEQEAKKRIAEVSNISENVARQEHEAQVKLREEYEKGNITFKEYKDKEALITAEYAEKGEMLIVWYLTKQVNDSALSADAKKEIQRKLTDDLKKLYELDQKNFEKSAESKEQKQQRLKDAIVMLTQQYTDFAQSAGDKSYQSDIANIEGKLEALSQANDQQIAFINATYMNEDEKKKALALQDTRYRAQQKQLHDEEVKEKRRMAAFDKEIAVAKALENTYVAASKYIDVPLVMAAIIALGLLQVGEILAEPLPQYKKGTKYKPDSGPAIVGEAGIELVREQSGREYLTPNMASVMNIPKGAEILPHEETMKLLQRRSIQHLAEMGKPVNENTYLQAILDAERRGSKEIVQAIKGKKDTVPVYIPVPDHSWAAYVKSKVR